eukprot:410187-Pyramimonas_sp.AAC.1
MSRKFKSRAYLSSMYDEDGMPCRSIDHSAEVLKDYWSKVFPPQLDQSLWPETDAFLPNHP